MKVLILGSGGREHALAWRLAREAGRPEILIAPGNPGTARLGRNIPIDLGSPQAALELAVKEGVNLTVVGPEAPLALGLADVFRRSGRPIVGPTQKGAALECSKAHAKTFMQRYAIPTADFVTCSSPESAFEAVSGARFGFPVVVKADGLAAGKGVTVAGAHAEAEAAVRAAMIDRAFGSAGSTVVVEECLVGPEVSMFYLLDGYRAVYLGSAHDHKRIWDDDRGPNTGGMGAFAPSPLATSELERDVARHIVQPVLEGHQAIGEPYVGFLYVSLMLTANGPKVIEFNVRFGDPEAQVVLPLLGGSFLDILQSAAAGELDGTAVPVVAGKSVGVVLASRGYPVSSESGQTIEGFDAAEAIDGVTVFHAGTKVSDGKVLTSGGRVLTVVAARPSFEDAMRTAYRAVDAIHFDGMQYRRDIGKKALARV